MAAIPRSSVDASPELVHRHNSKVAAIVPGPVAPVADPDGTDQRSQPLRAVPLDAPTLDGQIIAQLAATVDFAGPEQACEIGSLSHGVSNGPITSLALCRGGSPNSAFHAGQFWMTGPEGSSREAHFQSRLRPIPASDRTSSKPPRRIAKQRCNQASSSRGRGAKWASSAAVRDPRRCGSTQTPPRGALRQTAGHGLPPRLCERCITAHMCENICVISCPVRPKMRPLLLFVPKISWGVNLRSKEGGKAPLLPSSETCVAQPCRARTKPLTRLPLRRSAACSP